jgi:hypothetical protein
LNAWATRPTYAGEGLLVTRRWINCRPMNGPTLGCAAITSSARFRSPTGSGVVFDGMVVPRKLFSDVEWNCGKLCMGITSRFGDCVPLPLKQLVDVLEQPAQEKPVNTRDRPTMSSGP